MARRDDDSDEHRAVPTTRVARFARVARMAGGVAGGMIAEGTRQLRAGKRPRVQDMLLTPGNARRVAEQLATLRGAAMKVGQMLSMDAGDLLPPELADILARLRADARYMPPAQLDRAMTAAYGKGWQDEFAEFQRRPLAAASIGQVHRARTHDGRDIVVKVQYPGVADSIDADVDNIASLLRVSGLLPSHFDIAPLLAEAKAQLHEEADYNREAEFLGAFGELLSGDERFLVPAQVPELVRSNVLPMGFIPGGPIEDLQVATQAERDRVMSALVELMFRELFELRLVQTDPNFANYRYDEDSGRIGLLDFGATRRFKAGFVRHYRSLAKAAIAGHHGRLLAAAEKLGYAVGEENSEYRELVLELFLLAAEPLREEGPYDFARSGLAARINARGEALTQFRDFWQAPPADAIFFHRKLGGMFLLAARLRARVDVRALIEPFLAG